MEKHATTQEVKKELTVEDKERKAALVAKYGEISDSEEERYPLFNFITKGRYEIVAGIAVV